MSSSSSSSSQSSARRKELELCVSAEIGDFDSVVRLVVDEGVNINCKNERRQTPLMASVTNTAATKVTEFLVYHGADVNARVDDLLQTALHIACKDGNTAAVKLLLQAGADPYALDVMKRSVMHYSSFGGSPKVMEKLILRTKGVFINAADESGYTPLMIACEQGRPEIVHVLLSVGADPLRRNRLNHQAMELADWFGHKSIVEELERWLRKLGLMASAHGDRDGMAAGGPMVPPSPATAAGGTPVPGMMSPSLAAAGGSGGHGAESAHDAVGSARVMDPVGRALDTSSASVIPFGVSSHAPALPATHATASGSAMVT